MKSAISERRNPILVVCALLVPLLLGGCLIEEPRHVLHLERDGSVTWTAFESQVRSDEQNPREARREEDEFLSRARGGDHPMARALASLRPYALDSLLLREERPFAVFNEAWFPSQDGLAHRLLEEIGLAGVFEPLHDGDRRGFVLTLFPGEGDEEPADEMWPLLTRLEDYKLVLAAGKFVEAEGFEIVDGGTGAVPRGLCSDDSCETPTVYTLIWTVE